MAKRHETSSSSSSSSSSTSSTSSDSSSSSSPSSSPSKDSTKSPQKCDDCLLIDDIPSLSSSSSSSSEDSRIPVKKRLSVMDEPAPPKKFRPSFEASGLSPRTHAVLNSGPCVRIPTRPRKIPTTRPKPSTHDTEPSTSSTSSPKPVTNEETNVPTNLTTNEVPSNFIITPGLWDRIKNTTIPWKEILLAKRAHRIPTPEGNTLRFVKISKGRIKVRLQIKGKTLQESHTKESN